MLCLKIDPRFASQPKYIFTEETTEYLKHPSFNNWQWEENEMTALLEHMFSELGLIEHYKIELPKLKRFLNTVKDNYNNNPFHNFRHCFCVTQMMYGLLHQCHLVEKFEPLDKITLMISAICHDLDHPGFNNAYQINAKTDLATIYNDQSPLENHHCAVAFTILKDPETNILSNVSDKEWWEIRKGIIRCILATDMAKHGEYVNKLKSVSETFNINDTEHRQLLHVMLMKCSDISNEARPADVAEPWVDALLEEFFQQSDMEKAQGLPVAPFMDREKVTKAGAQIGFIGFVMIPLFECVGKVLPEINEVILPQIKNSHQFYKDLAAKQQAEQQQKQAAK
ncbi:Pde9 in complex with Ibmx [Rozella allomycis CSF55]|uniref:3',5'-cyclic-GMP phosphodiesterase n=1 Tax=Rozella allomycis (strain CSF55) TaxID=988480 RepID=A0A4P9YCI7_ROZAC|nr:Pde9 in complex with Ibmx [Rozella allomycis CSF55]